MRLGNDFRYALRSLAASPGFAAAAALTLALGIGANTAIFTAVYGVLLKPLPYGEPDRLVRIGETRRGSPWNVAYPNYLDWRARNHVFDGMAIFNTYGRVILTAESGPADVFQSGSCEVNMFAVMGIPPSHGRTFTVEDAASGAPAVVVLSDRAWHLRFGGDPTAIGRTVQIEDDAVTILGVLPPDVRPFDVDVWRPHRPGLLQPMQLDRANHPGFGVVARLRRGVSAEDAQREMSAIATSLEREYPASNTGYGVLVRPVLDAATSGIRPTLRLLMAAVMVLLLIACANVANLLLAKGLRRARETSVRAALGASRGAIVRLFLIEGLMLGLLGAAAGLLAAGWGVRLLHGVPGFALPRASEVAIDPHVLGFAAALGVLTAALFGLAPAMQLSRVDPMRVLRQSSAETASPGQARVRWTLVAGEVALLVVLLTGAALMQRSVAKLAAVDVGFDAARVLSVPLQQVQSRYPNGAAINGFATDLIAAAGRHPGVAAAALAWPFDATGFSWAPNVNLPEHPFAPGSEPVAQTAAVTPGYFAAMGIPIRRGRDFGPAEQPGAPVSAIVNQTFASRFFPAEDPIGRRVSAMRIPELADLTIVGVVGDTRRGGALRGYTPELYVPYAQFPVAGGTLVVRSSAADPRALAADIRAQVAQLDASSAIGSMERVSDAMARSYGDRRALSWLLGVFAVLALVLTTLGIGSVVAFTVAQRVTEIGVRMALGARPAEVVRLIVQGSLSAVVAGAAAGLLALVPLSRVLRTYLYGVSAVDPLALGAAVTVLLAAAGLAAYLPARRASRVDPLIALRG
ncbi:MAG TPA: ABC transporter permease [Vicinamibacterales bacterium]